MKSMKAIIKTLIIALGVVSHGASAGSAYSIEDAIYRIEIVDGNKIHYGTGVLISRNTILTNCHVVKHDGLVYSGKSYNNLFLKKHILIINTLNLCPDKVSGKVYITIFNSGEVYLSIFNEFDKSNLRE